MISNQICEANQENLRIWNSKFLFMIWSIIQVQTGASSSNLTNSWKSPPNSIKFIDIQTLEPSWFLIQYMFRIWGSFYKQSCSLLQNLKFHILFENFQIWEVYLLIKSIQTRLNFLNNWKFSLLIRTGSCLHVSILFGHLREYHLRSHRWSIPFESSYPDGGLLPLTLGYEKVLFHSEHPLKLLDQEDRVMKSDTSRVMKHNSILPGGMSPTHERKICMGDWKVFFLPSLPISSFLHDRCILRHFLCSPAFVNLGTIFLLRGGGYNTPCYDFTNHLH
jgi:hypothetical protein